MLKVIFNAITFFYLFLLYDGSRGLEYYFIVPLFIYLFIENA